MAATDKPRVAPTQSLVSAPASTPATGSSADAHSFAGWLPYQVSRFTPEVRVRWVWCGDWRANDPFFDHTLSGLLRSPLGQLLQRETSLAQLVALAEAAPGVAPAGFIFHVSRCGSTLVSQMLARLEGSVVLGEPAPLTTLLEHPRLSPDDRLRAARAWLRWMAAPPAGSRSGEPFVVKLEPRALLDWRSIRTAYPETPFVLVHRDPLEVLVSNLDSIAAAFLPGEIPPERLGSPARPIDSQETYVAFVLARLYAAAAELAREPHTLVVDYRELPGAIIECVLPHLRVSATDSERAAMMAATRLYSKDVAREQPFATDSERKRATASDSARDLGNTWLAAPYAALRAAPKP